MEQLEKNMQRERYQIRVCVDAGFTDNTTLGGLENLVNMPGAPYVVVRFIKFIIPVPFLRLLPN